MTAPGAFGIVTTLKAPLPQVLAFVAHHLSLGAATIWLCFDDPEDPAIAALRDVPQVEAIACDAEWWDKIGKRPERHQNRQARNAQRIWRRCELPWLCHIDVDEFLWPLQPLAEILARPHRDQALLRIEPYEAMHDGSLADDIYSARLFRAALKPRHAALRAPILGAYAEVLPEAMLSHSAGKCFFRTGIAGLSPRLHGAFHKGTRLPGPPFEPAVKLLHFHAQDRAAWAAALPFRLTRGAYQYHPALQAFLQAATPGQIDDFYQQTQSLTAPQAQLLRDNDRLIEADLSLRQRIGQNATLPGHLAEP